LTYLTDFAILRAVEKGNCPSKHFYTNNFVALYQVSEGRDLIIHQNGIVVVDNRSYGEAHLTKFLRETA